jgi:hypothetical protein
VDCPSKRRLNGNEQLPALIAMAAMPARMRFLEFFEVQIRNSQTRRAYSQTWQDDGELAALRPNAAMIGQS